MILLQLQKWTRDILTSSAVIGRNLIFSDYANNWAVIIMAKSIVTRVKTIEADDVYHFIVRVDPINTLPSWGPFIAFIYFTFNLRNSLATYYSAAFTTSKTTLYSASSSICPVLLLGGLIEFWCHVILLYSYLKKYPSGEFAIISIYLLELTTMRDNIQKLYILRRFHT